MADYSDIKAAFDNVCERKTGKAGDWVCTQIDVPEGQSGKKKGTLKLLATGNGIGSLKARCADSMVLFFVMAIDGVDARETVTSIRRKLLRVDFTGSAVTRSTKTIKLNLKGHIAELYNGTSVTLQVDSTDDIMPKDIVDEIVKAGAAHKPHYYDFGDGKWNIVDKAWSDNAGEEKKAPAPEEKKEEYAPAADVEAPAEVKAEEPAVEEPAAEPAVEEPAAEPAVEEPAADDAVEPAADDAPGDE